MKTQTQVKSSSRARRALKWLAVIVPLLLIAGYFGVGAVAAASLSTPERIFSSENSPAKFGLAYQDVRFPAKRGDVQIAGWYIPRESSHRVVILVHGRNNSRSEEFNGRFPELAAAMQRSGFSVLMIDLRGHGQSGDAHYSFGLNERRDVEGAVDWLVQKGYQPGSIGVLGVSLGAASTVGAAAEDTRISALVIDSLFASFCPIIQAQWKDTSGLPDFMLPPTLFMLRILYGYDLCDARPVDEIGKIAPRPVLIIHSTSDMLVPETNAEQLHAAIPSAQTWIVTGPEHARSYNADPAAYSSRVISFFSANLSEAAPMK